MISSKLKITKISRVSNVRGLQSKYGTPVLPRGRNKDKPTGQAPRVNAAFKEIKKKMLRLSTGINKIIDNLVVKNNNAANEDRYEYLMTPQIMEEIKRRIDRLYSESFMSSTAEYGNDFMLDAQIRAAYMSGASAAATSATTMAQVVASTAIVRKLDMFKGDALNNLDKINRAKLVSSRAFEEMKGLTAQNKASLSSALFRGIENGEGIASISKSVESAINDATFRAYRIARTEINGAYRVANRRETDIINEVVFEESDFEMRMLWYSALTSTTRPSHSERHGNTYTTQQVTDFYSVDANAINCYCSQTQVLVRISTGEVIQEDLVNKMRADRENYEKKMKEESEKKKAA